MEIFNKFSILLFLVCISFSSLPSLAHHQHHHYHPYHHHQDEEHNNSGDLDWWCDRTPHPKQCKNFLSRGAHHAPRHRSEFRLLALQAAIDRAQEAQGYTSLLGNKCKSRRKEAVWRDCYKLLNNTIFQLNQTLISLKHNSSSDFDVQTWLSAALTNLQTCQSGSHELNVSSTFIMPVVSSNLSELISNTLAVNAVLVKQQGSLYTDDYPSWVTRNDRKLLQTNSLSRKANVVVAADGSGRFRSIQEALNYATTNRRGSGRYIIYVKRGVYRENIEIGNNLKNIMLLGDGLRYTVITGSRSVAGGYTTYSSATVGVDGVGFIARGITFRNTAGPQNGQAVALRSASDLSVYYACGFEGYQDTLFVLAQRQFYKYCYIYGTIDFIFGNAAVVFQNSIIYLRKPLHGQVNVITAQGRGDPFQNTGISIQNSRVMAAPDLKPIVNTVQTYLGRPWQQYSRTVYMKTFIDSLVDPTGWLPWQNSNFAFNTLYYGEYLNFGPGAPTGKRVNWPGYHVITSPSVASQFTVANLIAGRSWLPATGVPFTAGL